MRSSALSSPRTTFQVLAICFGIATVDGFDTLVVAFIGPALVETWKLTPPELGRIFGAGLLGAALGGMTAGMVADRLGRRRTLLISIATFAVLTLACAYARSPGELATLRLFAGLGLGGAVPNIVALTAEHSSPQRRSAHVTLMFIGFPLGAVLGGALTAVLIEPYGWRAVFLIAGALPLLLVPAVWLGVAETLTVTRAERAPSLAGSMLSQFGEGRAPAVALLWLGVFSIMLLSYFLVNWIPTVLAMSGVPERQAIMGAVVLNLGGIGGALALTTFIDKLGPFRTVGLTLLAGSALVALLGSGLSESTVLMGLVLATGACVLGAQLSIPALCTGLFPMHVRGTGVGWTMGIGRLGSIIGPTVGGVLVGATPDWSLLFRIAAVPCLVAAVTIGAGHLIIAHRTRARVSAAAAESSPVR